MSFHLIEALTAAGHPDKPNEDAFSHGGNFAVVLDGSTALGPPLLRGPSDPAWLAQLAAGLFAQFAGHYQGEALLKAVTTQAELRFIAERTRAPAAGYETPTAAMMLVQSAGQDRAAALSFADCCVLVQRPGQEIQIIGEGFVHRGHEGSAAAALARSTGLHPAGNLHHPDFLADQRRRRNRHNTGEGRWVFAPDPKVAQHAARTCFDAPPGTILLLATDGFLALATDYGCYDAEGLLAAAVQNGLTPLLAQLRAVEQDDPEGRRFARFKTSDDATALLIRVL